MLLKPPPWAEYELLDSGAGQKLERFGPYRLIRPETQALWPPTLAENVWNEAEVVFQPKAEGPGHWLVNKSVPDQWLLPYNKDLAFWAKLTPFRHTGIFPEQQAHWEWMQQQLARIQQPKVLVLFGYTGLNALVAAQAGGRVCQVDASRPATLWAQANQVASQLQDKPIRWLVDDVPKFLRRELRRGASYDLITMDPPVFGRGPRGEVWRLAEELPGLVETCAQLLSKRSVGMLINGYATQLSALTLHNLLVAAIPKAFGGEVGAGELAIQEAETPRLLPVAIFARWSRR